MLTEVQVLDKMLESIDTRPVGPGKWGTCAAGHLTRAIGHGDGSFWTVAAAVKDPLFVRVQGRLEACLNLSWDDIEDIWREAHDDGVEGYTEDVEEFHHSMLICWYEWAKVTEAAFRALVQKARDEAARDLDTRVVAEMDAAREEQMTHVD